MEKLKHSHDVTIRWRSYELRPAGAPPLSEEYKQRILAARPRFNQIAKKQYGIEINNGKFGFISRFALIGAKYAEANGAGEAYHKNVLDAYWLHAQDIDDLDTLANLAEQSGLDRDAFLAAQNEQIWDDQVTADVEQAFQSGISGVPGMVFANKYLISGAQPYEYLARAVDQVSAELNASS